jgi:hypothetical protein
LVLIFLSLAAATVTWVGGSGDWNNTNNWSTDAWPGTNDVAVTKSINTPIADTDSCGSFVFNNSVQPTFQFTDSLPMG